MIFLLASLSLLASDLTPTDPSRSTEVISEVKASPSASLTYFEGLGTHAELIGACTAFVPFNTLYNHGEAVLGLPEFEEKREAFEENLRGLLAESFVHGRENPIEPDLTSERCDTLLSASSETMTSNLAAMRLEIEAAEKAAAATAAEGAEGAEAEDASTETSPATDATSTLQSPPASDAPQG